MAPGGAVTALFDLTSGSSRPEVGAGAAPIQVFQAADLSLVLLAWEFI